VLRPSGAIRCPQALCGRRSPSLRVLRRRVGRKSSQSRLPCPRRWRRSRRAVDPRRAAGYRRSPFPHAGRGRVLFSGRPKSKVGGQGRMRRPLWRAPGCRRCSGLGREVSRTVSYDTPSCSASARRQEPISSSSFRVVTTTQTRRAGFGGGSVIGGGGSGLDHLAACFVVLIRAVGKHSYHGTLLAVPDGE
jgi:hypothetical protein